MSLHRSLIPLAVAFSLIAAACGSTPETLASTEGSADVESAEQVSDDAVALESGNDQIDVDADNSRTIGDQAEQSTTTTDDSTDTTTSTVPESTPDSTETTTPAPTCVAPDRQPRWVDVAIDDPDGGLNVRTGAGANNAVLFTVSRGKQLITLSDCETVGTTEWWKVTTSDGSQTGWASSQFLSADSVSVITEGQWINDTENVGLKAETLQELSWKIAEAYGLEEGSRLINTVGEPEFHDAVGGNVEYMMLGLRDDSTDGYRIELLFQFDKDEANNGEVVGYIATRITAYPQCIRGVTADGICI